MNNNMRDLLDLINEMSEDQGNAELHDEFDIELSEDTLIESGIIDINEDGILIECDDKAIELLEQHGLILEETDWSKYDEPTVSRIAKGKTKPVDKTDYNKPTFLRKKEKEEDKKKVDESDLPTTKERPKTVMVQHKTSGKELKIDASALDKYKAMGYELMKNLDEKMIMGLPGDQGSKVMGEGQMKKKMHSDAEKMSLEAFCEKYGDDEFIKEFWHNINDDLDEAKYHGKEVPLGKKLPGDVKKSKVYVRKPNGKIVKVNFGDKNMRIKKSNPKRRKSFRARHNCKNPGPRWKARYWSCRSW
jgi:hypothetical protein